MQRVFDRAGLPHNRHTVIVRVAGDRDCTSVGQQMERPPRVSALQKDKAGVVSPEWLERPRRRDDIYGQASNGLGHTGRVVGVGGALIRTGCWLGGMRSE